MRKSVTKLSYVLFSSLNKCCLFLLLTLCFSCTILSAQTTKKDSSEQTIRGAESIQGHYMGLTVPLRDYKEDPNAVNEITRPEKGNKKEDGYWNMKPDSIGKLDVIDPVLQKSSPPPPSQNLQVTQSFDGLGFQGANPSDVNADVGPNHLIQMVNGNSGAIFQVFDKSGNILTSPFFLDNYLGFPGGLGDPIVLYDQEADRWMMSEFAMAGNHLHVAISQTNDPLGSWHIYIYDTPNFPDFPKFGIWNDAYIISVNEFSGGIGFVTAAVYALDRTKLLTGVTNNAQRLTLPDNAYGFHYLPLDVDGAAMAPIGSSPLLIHMNANSIEIWKMDIDFSNPANTSASLDITVNIAPFSANTISVDQPNSTTNLAVLFLRMMNRGQYRNFGTHESMVGCFDVDASGGSGHGVRWFEFRKISGGSWTLFQEGTYAPDTDSRWMPSIAMNADGAIGLMYNVVNGTNIFPSIRCTGRSAADPLGFMTLPETEVATGTTNNGSHRYGDYYSVSVDPSNGSFWITGQYNPTNNWASRIAQFYIGPDTDNDGFVDAADNCPGIANPNQFNWDSDNFGAACDCDDTNAGNNSIVINDDPIVSGTYLANDSISSNGTVPNSATVIFQAGKSIDLEPEFKALDGSDFTALIDGCDNSPVPDDIDMDGMLNVEDNCPYIPTIGLGFDGIDDYVEVPDADEISLVGDLTFEAWVKVTDYNNYVGILGKTLSNQPAPFDLYLLQNSGLPRFLIGDGTTSEFVYGTNAPAIGQWAHLAVVKNGTSITHYLNGAANGTGTITTIPADNNGTMIIGSRADLFTKMKGNMDELRIWNDARTITEINDNMNKELSGTEAGLVGYYRFNEGSPNADNTALNSIEDLSATANQGTPTNFAKSGTLSNWTIGSTINFLDSDNDGIGDPCSNDVDLDGIINNVDNCPNTPTIGLDFDGTDDNVEVPNQNTLVPTTTQAITFEAWVNPKVGNGQGMIASIYKHLDVAASNFYINRNNDGTLTITGNGTDILVSNGTIPENTWSHIALVFKENDGADQTKIYINGILDKTGDLNYNPNNGAENLRLGRMTGNGLELYFKGSLDDVRIWQGARNNSQITDNQNIELTGNETGLVGYYNFNEGTPNANNSALSSIEDKSVSANHGTPLNFAKTGTISNWIIGTAVNFLDSDNDGIGDPCDN